MLFNSLHFLVFFPLVTLAYFLLPHRGRWPLLLAASCYFYMCFVPVYILVLGFTIVVDYAAGILIEKARGRRRKVLLGLSILSNIGVLVFFKYFNFLSGMLNGLLSFAGRPDSLPYLDILLPIGLSFHTFQALSYTIEVYRGQQKAERHFGIYALYVMFYPQLVAGPIERPQNLLHQFREKHSFDYLLFTGGLKLMGWGMFKKVVIADRLALLVNPVYENPEAFGGGTLALATLFFAFQIYCDFSGYSDIAIGSAQCMGFRLMNNFNRPYFSKSVAEFWKRWHISLSTWFRDYLYIPLGGNRVPRWRWHYNLFITFLVSGLWHGASWTFVAWGALHGFYIVTGSLFSPLRQRLSIASGLHRLPHLLKGLNVLCTFFLVSFAWIFFRAESLSDAAHIVSGIFSGIRWNLGEAAAIMGKAELGIAFLCILILEGIHGIQRHQGIRQMLSAKPLTVRWAVYNLLILGILFLGIFNRTEFIYFRF